VFFFFKASTILYISVSVVWPMLTYIALLSWLLCSWGKDNKTYPTGSLWRGTSAV